MCKPSQGSAPRYRRQLARALTARNWRRWTGRAVRSGCPEYLPRAPQIVAGLHPHEQFSRGTRDGFTAHRHICADRGAFIQHVVQCGTRHTQPAGKLGLADGQGFLPERIVLASTCSVTLSTSSPNAYRRFDRNGPIISEASSVHGLTVGSALSSWKPGSCRYGSSTAGVIANSATVEAERA
jgi:hypothetical protein